jgi:hypothetical protein
MERKFENIFIARYINPPGIMRFEIIDMAEIDVREVEAMHQISLEFTQGEKYSTLFITGPMLNVSKEANEYGARPEQHINLVAQAVVIGSVAHRIMGNLLIRFYKNPTEIRLFTNENAAMEWLNKKMKAQIPA